MVDVENKENISTENTQTVDSTQDQSSASGDKKGGFYMTAEQLEKLSDEISKKAISGYQQTLAQQQKEAEEAKIVKDRDDLVAQISQNESAKKTIESVMPDWSTQPKNVIESLQKALNLQQKADQNTSTPVGFAAPLQSDGEIKSYDEAVDVAEKALRKLREGDKGGSK